LLGRIETGMLSILCCMALLGKDHGVSLEERHEHRLRGVGQGRNESIGRVRVPLG